MPQCWPREDSSKAGDTHPGISALCNCFYTREHLRPSCTWGSRCICVGIKKKMARHFDTRADVFWRVLSFSHALYTICMAAGKFSCLSPCDVLCERLFHLWNISKIRKIFTQHGAKKLVHAFADSWLDYCDSYDQEILVILWEASIHNAAGRVLLDPNPTCKVLKDQAASYLVELIVPYHHNSSLFSQKAGLLR